jgi:hypothetical protein
MAKFVIYHQAFDGQKRYKRYNCTTNCRLSSKKIYAKVYGSNKSSKEEDLKELEVCRKNFEFVLENTICVRSDAQGILTQNLLEAANVTKEQFETKIEYLSLFDRVTISIYRFFVPRYRFAYILSD